MTVFLTVVSAFVLYQFSPVVCDGTSHELCVTEGLLIAALCLGGIVAWGPRAVLCYPPMDDELRTSLRSLDLKAAGLLVLLFVFGVVSLVSANTGLSPDWSGLAYLPAVASLYLLFSRCLYAPKGLDSRLRALKWACGAMLLILTLVVGVNGVQAVSLHRSATRAYSWAVDGKLDEACKLYQEVIRGNRSLQLPGLAKDGIRRALLDQEQLVTAESVRKQFLLCLLYAELGDFHESTALLEELLDSDSAAAEELTIDVAFYDRLSLGLFQLNDWPALRSVGESMTAKFPDAFELRARYVVALTRFRSPQALPNLRHCMRVSAKVFGQFDTTVAGSYSGLIGDLVPAHLSYLLEPLSLLDLEWLLGLANWSVFHGAERIGDTGIEAPLPMSVECVGFGYGASRLLVGGEEYPFGYGYNLAVVDPVDGSVERFATFDTNSGGGSSAMVEFVDSIQMGRIVIAGTEDDAAHALSPEAANSLRQIGALRSVRGRSRWAHLVVGVKGAEPGTALERLGNKFVHAQIWEANIDAHETDAIVSHLSGIATQTKQPALYISGTTRQDSFLCVGP